MKAYLKELSRQLLGTVTDHPDVLEHFSTDASIFQVMPAGVIYPQNTADVRKTVQYADKRAAGGRSISLTARGLGSGRDGGSLGEGLQVVFPAHMNKLLRLDHDSVTLQPGVRYSTLQQTLHTHGRFLPPCTTGLDHTTLGGAVASDAAGEKSLKYGSMRQYVKSLKVVLADGSLIKTHRISARELSRKKGHSTMEGEVYRKLDSLILDHSELIAKHQPRTALNTAGYALGQVRHRDGSFDLSQIFIGSQGTLGLITEITLGTVRYNPRTSLAVGYFSAMSALDDALLKLRALQPSALELVDAAALENLEAAHTGDLDGLLPDKLPQFVLLVEFDDFSQFRQKVQITRAERIMARHGATVRVSTDPLEQVALWKIRHAPAAAGLWMTNTATKPALPLIDAAAVPPEHLGQLLDKTAKLLKKYGAETGLWGSAGDGRLSLYPRLGLARKKDVGHLLHLSREYHEMVIALGGTPSAGSGDGLLRSLYLKDLYGEDLLEVMASVKHVFDPHNIFNPMIKTGATEEYVHAHLRSQYSFGPWFDYPVSS